ncbi:hypothetical protein [Syntrophobacter fumaroxidans]|uniref:Uncharacterized protein n=1 Tax=Syntrophobacter fumaroxidans (strain DSM 10017 / MPOB) TaxID=335543 RepID=A0LER5_SYNFM|nr:hypothetical protein [Syntrophobacter fumaroxidans]ABK15917.1 hypothetical protein Sfum_0216 [Syntrophobacter fumaroxidans MPOB]
MRCSKCGFVSFDHQSECKGCGASLAAVRDELGLPHVKSALPFTLGSLTKEIDTKQTEVKGLVLDEPYDSTLPDIEFDDEYQGGSKPSAEQAPAPPSGGAARVSMEDLISRSDAGADKEDSFSLDLDFLQTEEPTSRAQAPAASAVDAGAGKGNVGRYMPQAAPSPAAPAKPSGTADDSLVIELSDSDLENILEDLKDVPPDPPHPGKGRAKIS